MRKQVFAWLLMALAPSAAFAQPTPVDFSGTWSGSFDIHFEDGRVIRDTAWLVLQQTGSTVSGSAGPKAEEQGPIREGVVDGTQLRFVADSTQGKILRFTLEREGEQLAGEARGDIGEDRVRVVVSVARAGATRVAAPPDPLYQSILALDTAAFDAFNHCSDASQLEKYARYFAKDVEFYHDNAGFTRGRDRMIADTRRNVCGKYRRELDLATLRVYAIEGFGAIAQGTHRFCHFDSDTCEGVGEFTLVWRQEDGQWRITRALSYAHRAAH